MPSRLRRHDEPGHIHFLTVSTYRRLQFFRHESVCDAFITAMTRTRESCPIRWLGYVVMPEHVHLVVLPQLSAVDDPVPISVVLRYLKGASGRLAKEALRDVWRRQASLGTRPLNEWATGAGERPFWKPRGYDFNLFHDEKLREKLDYIHANPVRRGLVQQPEAWQFSSFRFYDSGDDLPIAMDWDGGLPVLT
ncbi:MAG: transposase [Phycisphaerales bacterium]|nr:transposase [Phycisphaerales bacterium]